MSKTINLNFSKKILIIIFLFLVFITSIIIALYSPKEYYIGCLDGTKEKLECNKTLYCPHKYNFYGGEPLPNDWLKTQDKICKNENIQ